MEQNNIENYKMNVIEEIPEEELAKPLSLSEWGESIKQRMFSKSKKVI